LPTPVDIGLETEVGEPTVVDSLVDTQNTPLEAATAVVSHDPPSLTEEHMASEIDTPTLVEGVSAAALVESALVSEEQERTSVEVKDVAPVLEGQTTELTEAGVDGVREGPTIEEPKEDEETLATDSFPNVADGVGNNDVAPSQELVLDIQFATPTPIPEAGLAETSEESTPLPAVEPVLASASPAIEILAVPEAEESVTLDAVDEVEATGDEDSQPIYEELVADAEADAPMVDPVIPAPDTAAVRDSETMATPAEQPSGAENLFSTEVEAETVEDPHLRSRSPNSMSQLLFKLRSHRSQSPNRSWWIPLQLRSNLKNRLPRNHQLSELRVSGLCLIHHPLKNLWQQRTLLSRMLLYRRLSSRTPNTRNQLWSTTFREQSFLNQTSLMTLVLLSLRN
jgi:hypothetical protein